MSIQRLPWLYDSESVAGWRFIKAVVFIVIGLGVLFWQIFHRTESGASLQQRGVEIEGKVYKVQSLPNGRAFISYGFTADGKFISIEERRVADLADVDKLGPITVWYDPANPQHCVTPNELRREESSGGPAIGIGVLLVMVALSAFQIYAILTRRNGAVLGD